MSQDCEFGELKDGSVLSKEGFQESVREEYITGEPADYPRKWRRCIADALVGMCWSREVDTSSKAQHLLQEP